MSASRTTLPKQDHNLSTVNDVNQKIFKNRTHKLIYKLTIQLIDQLPFRNLVDDKKKPNKQIITLVDQNINIKDDR